MNFEPGEYVKVEKLEAVDNPVCPTPEWEDYVEGRNNPEVSIPVAYTCTGTAPQPPQIGHSFMMWRDTRNGIKVQGYFTTSTVRRIESVNDSMMRLYTDNSCYMISRIPRPQHSESGESQWQ